MCCGHPENVGMILNHKEHTNFPSCFTLLKSVASRPPQEVALKVRQSFAQGCRRIRSRARSGLQSPGEPLLSASRLHPSASPSSEADSHHWEWWHKELPPPVDTIY